MSDIMLQESIEFQLDGYHAEVIGEATPDILVSRFVSPLITPNFLWVSSHISFDHHFSFIFVLLFLIYLTYVCYWVYFIFRS